MKQTKHEISINIIKIVFDFFINSADFNGIPLRSISEKLGLDYKKSIDIIKMIVTNGEISIQSSTNPHIIGFKHYDVSDQLGILEQAKSITSTVKKIAGISFACEETEYPICLYPSPAYLKDNRDLEAFLNATYSKRLALAEPQLTLIFFDIEVLERYAQDPRYEFSFNDYSGRIYCKYDDQEQALLEEKTNPT